ncbi:hypothetical protein [Pseudarthrobacter phenanthrenivorans]|uniref:Uncharacterized protein n=1 Tax=Pseudarthrobacter phenanthrenivorans TaxID=361575 RepID=A0A0B4EPS2_PSEPS|nr:hypothetical protein [Pseudarthrobacter phenanthrenivorans]KIC68703.1 hypothetical protein RM50_04380 [Pseudarthrobacter phenanthrenivorans]
MTPVAIQVAEAKTGTSKEDFMRHYELVYGVHEDHYREQDPNARLGVSWSQPYSFDKWVTDKKTGEREYKHLEGSTMRTEHVSMFDPERLWEVTQRTIRKHSIAYVGYVPRKGSIVDDEHNGSKTRGKEKDLLDLPEIIVDIDTTDGNHKETNLPTNEQALGFLAECPLGPPTFTNRSGGGYHGHFCLTEPVPLEEARALWDRMADWIENLSEQYGVHAGDEKVTRNPAILFRMAGTLYGKPGANTNRRVEMVQETGLRYSPDDFDRLPVRMKRVKEQIARQDRELARRTRSASLNLSDDERKLTPWYRMDRELPVSEILERVFFMQHNGTTMTSPDEWLDPDSGHTGTAAHVTLYNDSDGVERFTANGQRTAGKLSIPAGSDSYGSFSLLVERFCNGCSKMAAAVAKRFLDDDIEGLLTWMEENVNGVKADPEPEPQPVVSAEPFDLTDEDLALLARGVVPIEARDRVVKNCTAADAAHIIHGEILAENDPRSSWDIVVGAIAGDAQRAGRLTKGVRSKQAWIAYLERIAAISRAG